MILSFYKEKAYSSKYAGFLFFLVLRLFFSGLMNKIFFDRLVKIGFNVSRISNSIADNRSKEKLRSPRIETVPRA